ncbi:MAG: zinc ribbon domain-containing protein [Burkholderiales bacterium]|nr:zinc ribbon domain-containing protein [Burkholderiales bacterium]
MSPSTLECPSCSHGNPAGSNYCNACGMPVGFRWCPQCEAVNQTRASHCHKCGGAFAADDAAEDSTIPATAADVAAASDRSSGRRLTLRVASASVLLVALAIPGYLTRQEFTPAPPLAQAWVAPPVLPTAEPSAPAPESIPAAPASTAEPAPATAKPRSGSRKSRNATRNSKKQSAGSRNP